MYRNQIFDSRQWTSGGLNSAFFGQYRSRYQSGADRSPGSAQTEEHDYSCSHVSRTYGYFKWYNLNNPNEYGYSLFSPQFASPVWTANDDLALIGKLRNKWDSTSFNGGNFLGELPQTANLLGGKLGLLGKALALMSGATLKKPVRYRRGKRRPPRKETRVTGDSLIADSWLEFSFGIRPLIDDIYELADIASKQNVARRTIRVSRKGIPGPVTSPWSYAAATGETVFSKQIIARLEQESLPTFWEQFGLADPATIAWELLPWSFVVDWVLPIGKFVEAQSFARRAKGTFITTERTRSHWSMSITGNAGAYANTQMLGEAGTTVSITRTVSNTLNVPLPSFKSNLLGGRPLERITNALALIGQVFKPK